ncbi:MAG: hypothetical protein WCD79_23070 [Chthoniobacteraceae bacterium]
MEPDSTTPPSRDVEIGRTMASPEINRGDDMEWREYLFFREELRHEDNLINQRVSWLVGSQAFLLGAFATLITSTLKMSDLGGIRNYMLVGLPVAGITGVLANYVTILGAVLHIRGVRRLVADKRTLQMPSLGKWHGLQLRMGLFGPLVTPLIFLAFWTVILIKIG